MSTLDKVLSLRPTNAVARLGRSRLPLLNPRDLVRGLEGQPCALLSIPLATPALVPGLLRAARDRDAVLGLACVHPPPAREGPVRFFEAVRAAADEVRHCRPVFLQAGPVRVTSADARFVQELSTELYRYVDAGFSLLSLDGSGLPRADDARVCAELAQIAAERELAIEVTAPKMADGRPSTRGLRTYLEDLRKKKIEPRFVRLRSSVFMPDALPGRHPEADLAGVEEFAAVAAELGVWLTIDDRGSPSRTLNGWAAEGVRKVDAGEPFAALASSALPPERREELREQARKSPGGLAEVMGRAQDLLAGLEEGARDRIEALAYGEVSEVLQGLGLVGSATRAMGALAESSGY